MELSAKQQKLISRATKGFIFSLYLFFNLPMGWIAGLRIRELTTRKCTTSVPFKWLNKNPFRSTYFAVQSMAAELSTATGCLLATRDQNPSVAFIIVDLQVKFLKKATGRVYFTCDDVMNALNAVNKCIETGGASMASFKTVGKMKDGTVVSEFEFTWSFKQRSM